MKRDIELFRALLLAIEDKQEAGLAIDAEFLYEEVDGTVEAKDLQQRQVAAHLQMLHEEGLVEGQFRHYMSDRTVMAMPAGITILRITSAGHDFIDSVRNETVWKKTKAMMAKAGGAASLEAVKKAAGLVIAAALEAAK